MVVLRIKCIVSCAHTYNTASHRNQALEALKETMAEKRKRNQV